MKNAFLLFLMTWISLPISAQITVERSDYTREVGTTIRGISLIIGGGLEIPTGGANQVWDYSRVRNNGSFSSTTEVGNHPDFPEANLSYTVTQQIFGFIDHEYTYYESLNEDYYGILGRTSSMENVTLEPLSGNNQDSLMLNGTTAIYEEPNYYYQFPIEFGNTTSSNYTIPNDVVVTVQGFGVDHVPGERIFYISETQDVIGHGTLILPHPNGAGNLGVDVLLMKEERVTIDSLFLGGQPGPPALIAAFGLEQGAITTSTRYTFVAKGLPRAAMSINLLNGVMTSASYADGVKDIGVALNDVLIIERPDYTREIGGEVVTLALEPEGIAIPTQGASAQDWDYSNVAIIGSSTRTIMGGTHPDIPTANIQSTINSLFFGLINHEITFYESLNGDFYGTLGRTFTGGSASLEPISGSETDTLKVLAGIDVYEEPIYNYQFPLAFGDNFGSTISTHRDYELTVMAFGLDKVPGELRSTTERKNTASSYGVLTLPHPDGTGTISIEALLITETIIGIDSFFLAGQPAPDALLAAFGLTQGSVGTATNYTFVAKGLPRSAMYLNVINGEIVDARMADEVKNLMTSTSSMVENLARVQVFPNPSDGNFELVFDKTDARPWNFTLYNSMGQQVRQQTISGATGTTKFTAANNGLLPLGTYFFTLENADGIIVSVEKVMIR